MITDSNRVYFDKMLSRRLQEGRVEKGGICFTSHYWGPYSRIEDCRL